MFNPSEQPPRSEGNEMLMQLHPEIIGLVRSQQESNLRDMNMAGVNDGDILDRIEDLA